MFDIEYSMTEYPISNNDLTQFQQNQSIIALFVTRNSFRSLTTTELPRRKKREAIFQEKPA